MYILIYIKLYLIESFLYCSYNTIKIVHFFFFFCICVAVMIINRRVCVLRKSKPTKSSMRKLEMELRSEKSCKITWELVCC